jgi:DNA-binding MarR family transcriptional regulator
MHEQYLPRQHILSILMKKTPVNFDVGGSNTPAAFYCAKDYRPEDSMGHLMRQILIGVAHQVESQLSHTGLTNAQWVPLFKLYIGKASTVAELARECQLDTGAMTRTLDRLESKSLCRRVRSSSDRRVVNITLTDAGRTAAAEIPHLLSRVQNANLSGFSADEFETLKSFLRRILVNGQTLQQKSIPTTTGNPDAA